MVSENLSMIDLDFPPPGIPNNFKSFIGYSINSNCSLLKEILL